MSDMVERVAAAMFEYAEAPTKWGAADDADKKLAKELARAAIAAMGGDLPDEIVDIAAANLRISKWEISDVFDFVISEVLK